MTTSYPSFVARRFLILWMSIISFLQLNHECEGSYIVEVQPYDEQCFYVAPPTHSTIYGDFELLEDRSSAKHLSILITDVHNSRTLYRSRTNARSGSFKVNAEPREKIYICIQNAMLRHTNNKAQRQAGRTKSDGLPRTVGIDFSIVDRDLQNEIHQSQGVILSSAVSLTRHLSKLMNGQEYMRAREAKHRETAEFTFSKLMGWTIAQGAGVILIAVGQVLYLRRYLEQRRYM